MIRNPSTNTCLTFSQIGQNVDLTPCDANNPKQKWSLQPDVPAPIQSKYNPKICVDRYDKVIYGGVTRPKLWTCNSGANQNFLYDTSKSSISADNHYFDIYDPAKPQLNFWNKSQNTTNQTWKYELDTPPATYPKQVQPIPATYSKQVQPVPATYPKLVQPIPATYPKQVQPIPATYPKQAQPVPTSLTSAQSRSRGDLINIFKQDQINQHDLNQSIPKNLPPGVIRLVTYNVHMWSRPEASIPVWQNDDFNAILTTIEAVDADILVLEEVFFDPSHTDFKERFEAEIARMGFKYTSFCKAHEAFAVGAFFGNYLLSKLPIVSNKVLTLEQNKEGRCAIVTTIQLPSNQQLVVIGTHLDIYDETEQVRMRQVQQILKYVETDLSGSNVVITGDFNSLRRSDYTDEEWNFISIQDSARGVTTVSNTTNLLELAGWKTSFAKLNAVSPKSTTWPGRTVDHIYFNPGFKLQLLGSYVYHDSASDHLPLLVDLHD